MHLIRIGRNKFRWSRDGQASADVIAAGQIRNNRGNQCAMAEILLDSIVCEESVGFR
jgi:hypothetical protein